MVLQSACKCSLSWQSCQLTLHVSNLFLACKRKDHEMPKQEVPAPKKPRLVFTDIQRRTLLAIFKETKRPSKEMQATIAEQLGLKVSTVANFFMNARRRSLDKYTEDTIPNMNGEHMQHHMNNNNMNMNGSAVMDPNMMAPPTPIPMGIHN